MNDTYKPGNVAMVAGASDSDGVRAIWQGNQWATSTGRYLNHWQVTVRPLVVIDPEDREAVALILSYYHDWKWTDEMASASIADMQAALREFADPKPPKPEEPMGKWAIVTAFGVTYCRAAWASDKPWSRVGTDHFASWDELVVESIEFEGVR